MNANILNSRWNTLKLKMGHFGRRTAFYTRRVAIVLAVFGIAVGFAYVVSSSTPDTPKVQQTAAITPQETVTPASKPEITVTLTKVEEPAPVPQPAVRSVTKPMNAGEYARNSKRWQAFIANCTDDGMSQSLRDEAARKIEAMSEADFQKQIQFCSKRTADLYPPQQPVQPQMAQTGYAMGGAAYQPQRRHGRHHGNRDWSQDDASKLDALAQKYLGPLPQDARGYASQVTRDGGSPASGCVQVNTVEAGRGTFTRWRCPQGTVGQNRY